MKTFQTNLNSFVLLTQRRFDYLFGSFQTKFDIFFTFFIRRRRFESDEEEKVRILISYERQTISRKILSKYLLLL